MSTRPSYREFLAPRHWGYWLLLGLFRVLVFLLPLPWLRWLGRVLGRTAFRLLTEYRRTAECNIAVCFPHLDGGERRQMLKHSFESLGMSVFELVYGWWTSPQRLRQIVEIEGLEYLEASRKRGKGTILLTAHFSLLDSSGLLLCLFVPDLHAMYRPVKKQPFVDEVLRRGRELGAEMVAKEDVRGMLRSLRRNKPVAYAPDQSYRRRYSALVPFFSEPAMTTTATHHIARISGATVIPWIPLRRRGNPHYHLRLLPPLENFPTDDPIADTLRINKVLEQEIRQDPTQYYWIHRRFKGRPPPYPDLYAKASD